MFGMYRVASAAATPTALTVRDVPPALGSLPRPAGVDVWLAPFDRPTPFAPLNAEEQARADRYRLPRPREQFTHARGLLRALLAAYLDCSHADVRFTITADGKPELVGSELFFNVTHTDGLAVVAVSTVRVGVDAEHARPSDTADALVERFFAPPERRQYTHLPVELRPAAFLRGWTCKEAILKGVGCGARGLERCVVDLDPREPPRVVKLGGPVAVFGETWNLWCDDRHGTTVAVAWQGG